MVRRSVVSSLVPPALILRAESDLPVGCDALNMGGHHLPSIDGVTEDLGGAEEADGEDEEGLGELGRR